MSQGKEFNCEPLVGVEAGFMSKQVGELRGSRLLRIKEPARRGRQPLMDACKLWPWGLCLGASAAAPRLKDPRLLSRRSYRSQRRSLAAPVTGRQRPVDQGRSDNGREIGSGLARNSASTSGVGARATTPLLAVIT